ncbi:MAG: GNAT family N-acetyltransferase [Candidatus Binataceae bacterium]
MIEARRMMASDMPAILRIQLASYVGNLSPDQRAGGFLSAEYTDREIERMAADVAVMVAAEDGDLLGFLCAYSPVVGAEFPIVARMFEQFGSIIFNGQPLGSRRILIYGPVCVESRARGRGLVRILYDALRREVAERFDTGTALIARDNPYSFRVHVERLGMSPVGEFDFEGRRFTIVAFEIPPHLPHN